MRVSTAILLIFLGGCNNTPSTAGQMTSDLTWWRDVKPIVETNCLRCHTAGGIAPFSLEDYATAKSHAAEINVAVANRVMPPWLAGQGCNDYRFDRSLTEEEIGTMTTWATGGTPEGDPATYVAPALKSFGGISRVDATLTMPVAYTPKLSPDDYRCFIIDWPATGTKYVTGF